MPNTIWSKVTKVEQIGPAQRKTTMFEIDIPFAKHGY